MSAGSHSMWWRVRRGPLPTTFRYTVRCASGRTLGGAPVCPSETLIHLLLFLSRRLSRSSQDPRHHPGSLPVHRVHWSDPAGGVEGAGVRSRP